MEIEGGRERRRKAGCCNAGKQVPQEKIGGERNGIGPWKGYSGYAAEAQRQLTFRICAVTAAASALPNRREFSAEKKFRPRKNPDEPSSRTGQCFSY